MSLYTSVLTGGANQAPTTSGDINSPVSDFFSPGIVGAITANTGSGGTGGFAVNAEASPNMNVRVSQGTAYVTATPSAQASQLLRVFGNTFTDVAISSNASGSTRFDWVYISISASLAAAPDANKTTVATLVTSRSTSSSVDNGTPPTYGYCIGIVTVANGAVSITNSNITEKRTQTGAITLDTNTNNSVLANQIATNAITLGYAAAAASQTGISTITDLTSLTVTVTVPAGGRRIFIHGHIDAQGSVANLVELGLWEGATELQTNRSPMNATGGWTTGMDVFWSSSSVTAGSHTYKLRMDVAAGGGTGGSTFSATSPVQTPFILVAVL